MSDEFQDGGDGHIDIHFFGPNSVIVGRICTIFRKVPENGALEPDLPSVVTSAYKFQDVGGRHFVIILNGHNSAIFERPNVKKIWLPKIQNGGRRAKAVLRYRTPVIGQI